MKAMKLLLNLGMFFGTLPIWYFLLYTILSAIHPDRLVWFLYWVYVPLQFFMVTLNMLVERFGKDAKKG
jgi:hypothetical protein